jgi:NADPH-dependent 2,4-dienoyl-CoA reductase/sulfur reductase-like enzyme
MMTVSGERPVHEMKRQRIVIVGASLAGATAAATLRDEGFDGEIRLIGAEARLPYNRPPLSKGYLRQQERFEDQLVKPAGYYAEQRIALTLGVRATAIDAKQKLVELEGGERVAYDRLLVTTGGRNRTLSVPGATLEGVFQLRTVEDCDRIRAATPRARRAVVAGIGIVPNTELLAAAGAEVDNGVLVDEHCRTSLPDVFAAGDVTNHLHPVFGRLRVEHWNNGYQQGRAAARALLGGAQPYDYIHSFWSDQYEHTLEYVGFATRWDRLVFRGRLETRKFLGFYLDRGIIRAAVGLDRGGDPDDPKGDGELKAAASLIRNRVSVDPAKLGDEAVELRSLVTPVTGR